MVPGFSSLDMTLGSPMMRPAPVPGELADMRHFINRYKYHNIFLFPPTSMSAVYTPGMGGREL